MRSIRTRSAGALLLVTHVCALSQTDQQALQIVTISAGASDQRARSTTTTIIVGRDDILRQGDAALSEVLKRQPGISVDASPGKSPAIRMRGMGEGYVAILLNGLPAPGDFSLESISPDLVERIEIQRIATAETSSQAIAGTINVILRRAGAARTGGTIELKAGGAFTQLGAAPQLVLQNNGRTGTFAYGLTATFRRQVKAVAAVATEQGADPALLRHIAWTDDQVEHMLELAPRLSWQPSPRDTITSQSYLRKRFMDNSKREEENTETGNPTAFPHAVQSYKTRPVSAYADAVWTRRLAADARLAVKLSGFYTTRDADFVYRGMSLRDNLLEVHRVASGPTERELAFNGNWRRPLLDHHALVAGWEFGRKQRGEYRRERQTDADGGVLRFSDENYRAEVSRSAFFIQDEWDIDAAWSAYAGLRRETLHTTGEGNADAPVDVHAGAWSPVLQALFKPLRPDGYTGPRDQFRLAASRTYKAPGIVQLMPRRYTVDNNNNATNPDQQGNPRLRPELTFGLDLAWERFVGKDDMVGVSAFHKRIRDITLLRIAESGGAWTAVPENQGGATMRGLEFEARTLYGPLAVRVNLARNWSRLDSVPGPDNRIEGQAGFSGNVGLDFASAIKGVDVGGTYTYRGRVVSRSSALHVGGDGGRRQLDLYAVWRRDVSSRLRLSVSDLLHADYRERLDYQGDDWRVRSTTYRMRPTWRVMWEQSL